MQGNIFSLLCDGDNSMSRLEVRSPTSSHAQHAEVSHSRIVQNTLWVCCLSRTSLLTSWVRLRSFLGRTEDWGLRSVSPMLGSVLTILVLGLTSHFKTLINQKHDIFNLSIQQKWHHTEPNQAWPEEFVISDLDTLKHPQSRAIRVHENNIYPAF